MRTLNLGILAHVDAGKTSLTERLLFNAGIIDQIGRVDEGSTQTDTLDLERRRGITIKSAVVSFVIGATTVNLIDTPGHPDFIAEVERVLNVLDGAVLVVSAVEGVQAQTRILMRALRRLGIPTLIFVNKIDRKGAGHDWVLHAIAGKLAPRIVPMGVPSGLGAPSAAFSPYGDADGAFITGLTDVLAHHDDALLTAYVRDEGQVSPGRLKRALIAQTAQASVHPVFFGSAITGAGVDALSAGITELLPLAGGAADGPVSGTVFKVERGPAGEKISYVRLFSGTVRVRDRLRFGLLGKVREGRVTAIGVFEHGSEVRRPLVAAGQIARLWGPADLQIGDGLGDATGAGEEGGHFPPPTLETAVLASAPERRAALHVALSHLAEQDPLINLRQDDIRQEIYVSLYGEVQKEVIQATLADDFGLDVTFRETTTICIERPNGRGAAVEVGQTEENPFLATIGLRVDPAPIGTGVAYRLEVEPGSMPYSFMKAVEETVHETLREGIHGWQVTDCLVTMIRSGYWPRQSHAHGTFDKSMSSTAGDFRNLTPLVLMNALRQAGTRVFEPMHRFRLEAPADTVGPLMSALSRLRAVAHSTETREHTSTLEGEIPAGRVHELGRLLPGLTRGEGIVESGFDHYRAVQGQAPERPRTDHNPLNRKEYLLHVVRRV